MLLFVLCEMIVACDVMQGRLKDSLIKRKVLRPKKVLQLVKSKEKQGTQLTKKRK